ncbi:MAG: hypothetical protein J4G16_09965 [Acidobacteria bacterium]|nr:hypothetical protein [Acidobacteriota bacterium]
MAARTTGWLTMWNTGGAMCGPPAAAFVLLPVIGMEAAFFVLAAAYGAVGVAIMPGAGSWRMYLRTPAVGVCGLALAAGLARFPFGSMNEVYLPRVAQPYAADGSEMIASREGPSETILLMQQRWLDQPVYNRLVTNGFSMSGTAVSGLRYMRYFAYWPMFAHPGPLEQVLVICYGVGVTVGAALDLPGVESIDVVEISPDIVAMSDLIHPSEHPLRDPRVEVHIDDGRQFLHRTSERYDLITGGRGQHLYPRVLPAHPRPPCRRRHRHLLAACRPTRPRNQRQRDHPSVLRRVRRLFALERDPFRSDACGHAERERSRIGGGVRAAVAPARPARAPGGDRTGVAATDRGNVPRRRRLPGRVDGGPAGARRQPSPPTATGSSRAVLVRSRIRQQSTGHRALRRGPRPGTSPRRADALGLPAPPVARRADRGVPALLRAPARSEPRDVGRRPAARTDRGPALAADRVAAAHAPTLGSGQRRGEGAHRATG